MSTVVLEVVVILALVVANGLLAMMEIAVVSARKGRLEQLARAGNRQARAALELAGAPGRFLATVQIGITLVGILAGAFGGATIASVIAERLRQLPWVWHYAETISLGIVVVVITYLSLILGELVPKGIGLRHPEGIAMWAARPMQRLSRLARPVVGLLTFSTEALLRLLRVGPPQRAGVTEEDVRGLMQEGLRAGAFSQVESQIVHQAFELDRILVQDLMTPRPKIMWLNVNDPHQGIWHKIVVSGHSNFPVYEGNRDRVVGMVSLKAIYANLAAGIPIKLKDLVTAPLFVPAAQTAVQVLESFKQSGQYIALATDEFGAIVGLVALHDVMEAVLGDFPSPEERLAPAARKREDGSWLIDAMIEVERVERVLPGFQLSEAERGDFRTLAGFVVKRLGHVPKEGETFECQGYIFEVLDMDGHRVDKVLVVPERTTGPGSCEMGRRC